MIAKVLVIYGRHKLLLKKRKMTIILQKLTLFLSQLQKPNGNYQPDFVGLTYVVYQAERNLNRDRIKRIESL